MADTGIFATTAEVQRKVGVNASATSNTEAYINQYMTEIESFINIICGVNFSDTYSSLNVDVKGILKLASSNHAAWMVLNYDTSGMSQREAERRMDVLFDNYNKAMAQLKDKVKTDFITAS
jgi:hypothetical protein